VGFIRASLATLIDKRDDDVRFYPVPEPVYLVVFGRKALPEGLRVATALQNLADRTAGHCNYVNFWHEQFSDVP
jgi:hypothetical protein